MQKVKIRKDEARAAIQSNRDAHRKIFEEALSGYRECVIEELERRIAEIREGKHIDQYIRMEVPVDHTGDYDRVLKMLEMSVDDEVELTASDFDSFIMDNWKWKQDFVSNSAMYTS